MNLISFFESGKTPKFSFCLNNRTGYPRKHHHNLWKNFTNEFDYYGCKFNRKSLKKFAFKNTI